MLPKIAAARRLPGKKIYIPVYASEPGLRTHLQAARGNTVCCCIVDSMKILATLLWIVTAVAVDVAAVYAEGMDSVHRLNHVYADVRIIMCHSARCVLPW